MDDARSLNTFSHPACPKIAGVSEVSDAQMRRIELVPIHLEMSK
jgi:hypothetical protein